MNILDVIGTILSLIGTYYFIKADIKMWIIYLLATCVNMVLYFQYNMLGSMSLEFVYFCTSFYGFIFWYKLKNEKGNQIDTLKSNEYFIVFMVWVALSILIYYFIRQFIETNFLILETFAVSTSLVGQLLTSRKYIECWYVWMVADSLFLCLMASQLLYFHTFLFMCYLWMACLGLSNWYRIKNNYTEITN